MGSLSPTVTEKLLIELLFNRRGNLDYARNIANSFDHPKRDNPSAGEEDLPEWCVCGNCVPMENPLEQKCCTMYELFQNLSLDRNILVAFKARCDMRADDLDLA